MSFVSDRVIPLALRAMRAQRPFSTADAAHARVAELALRPRPYGPPRAIRRDVTFQVGRRYGWPIYTVRPRHGAARGRVVYAHGGGWAGEIAAPHWYLIAQIAAQARTAVTVPIYPLSPFATAADVVPRFAELAAGRLAAGPLADGELVAGELDCGDRPNDGPVDDDEPACLVGDSAGGQIALSAALLARDRHGVRLPRTVLIAPALDLGLTHPGIEEVAPHDPWLAVEGARVLANYWRGDLPLEDPLVSPIFGDLTELGPLTVFIGTRDILLPDAHLLTDKARAVGVDVTLHEEPGVVHVHPLTPTPEGRAARRLIVEDVRAAFADR